MVRSISFWIMLLAISSTLLGVTAFSTASIGIALLATALIVALRLAAHAEGARTQNRKAGR